MQHQPAALIPASPPQTVLPLGACDSHVHVYDDLATAPLTPNAAFAPVTGGTIDTYLALRRVLGLTRAVVVQPTAYGTDNRCTLAAMARMGQDARAVVVVDETTDDAELDRLTRAGVRGLRFFMLAGGIFKWQQLAPLAARVATFGWHIQLQMDGRFLQDREADLMRLPCPLVIDHNGKFLEPVGTDHPGFAALCRLIDSGKVWVKTSGVYETSRSGAPDYADVALLARNLIDRFPERCVWATNWPHPSRPGNPPDDAHLLDLFAGWCGGAPRMHRILVENPAKLYGF